jgi:hypothetical protein
MTADIATQTRALDDMTVDELKRRWAEVFGEEAPNSHPRYLVKRLAWRIQANAEGDISERARRRAEELANDADLRRKAPKRSHDIMSNLVATGELPASHDPRLPMPGSPESSFGPRTTGPSRSGLLGPSGYAGLGASGPMCPRDASG